MTRVLIDTDVLVDVLRGQQPYSLGGAQGCYSTTTRAELYSATSADKAVIEPLLAALAEFEVDREIANRAGAIRRATSITTPDAIIAATAVVQDLELATRNQRDFARVEGLRLAT